MPMMQTRRQFLASASLAGAAGLLRARVAAAEEPPSKRPLCARKGPRSICVAPQILAEELLRAEGFTDVRYVDGWPTGEYAAQVGQGKVDFSLEFAAKIVQAIDDGGAITVLAGVHVGCFELFGNDEIRSIADLKGKTVGVQIAAANPHAFLTRWPPMSGSTPARTSAGSPDPVGQAARAFRRGQDRCLPRLSARAAGAARPPYRPRDLQ